MAESGPIGGTPERVDELPPEAAKLEAETAHLRRRMAASPVVAVSVIVLAVALALPVAQRLIGPPWYVFLVPCAAVGLLAWRAWARLFDRAMAKAHGPHYKTMAKLSAGRCSDAEKGKSDPS